MFCRNCGNQLDDKAVACTKCGADPKKGVAYCSNCGKPTDPNAVVCVSCGVGFKPAHKECNKIAAGLLGILLGYLGIHKFIMGYQSEGLIMLLVSVLTCGFAAPVMWIIGLIEGIIYLTKSDEDFIKTYVEGRKGWF
jgi:TM2 domain-containing membrane protein YozV